jgi:hypothetical protein
MERKKQKNGIQEEVEGRNEEVVEGRERRRVKLNRIEHNKNRTKRCKPTN